MMPDELLAALATALCHTSAVCAPMRSPSCGDGILGGISTACESGNGNYDQEDRGDRRHRIERNRRAPQLNASSSINETTVSLRSFQISESILTLLTSQSEARADYAARRDGDR